MYKRSPFSGRTLEELLRYIDQEFDKLEQFSVEVETEAIRLQVKNAEPRRPLEGMLAVADGVNWNPGNGAGPYYYNSNEWLPLITATTAERPRKTTLNIVGFAPKFTNTSQIVRPPKAILRFTKYSPR